MPRALITGITGQDGSYLAELLLRLDVEVVGLTRRDDPLRPAFAALAPGVTVLEGDLQDQASLEQGLRESEPDEVYNLAAFSQPARSWTEPERCCDITGLGVLRLLEAVRTCTPNARFLQASSSEIFGRAVGEHQDEDTPLRPQSPYGAAKALAHTLTGNYRDAHGLHASCAILFNHESPRRGPDFVTRKITRGVAAIALGRATELRLGNLEVRRDWGHAADYVEAMRLIAQQGRPGDYVISSGTTHSLREFLDLAFAAVDIHDWAPYVVQDPAFFRPAEPDVLCGDPSRAEHLLGWQPQRSFGDLVAEMVQSDLADLRN